MNADKLSISSIIESCELVSAVSAVEFEPLSDDEIMAMRLEEELQSNGKSMFLVSGSSRQIEAYDPRTDTQVYLAEFYGITDSDESEHIFTLGWDDELEVHIYFPSGGYAGEVWFVRESNNPLLQGRLVDGKYPHWHARILGGLAALASDQI